MEKKKILIVADDPFTKSGFGNVMYNLLKNERFTTSFDITYITKNSPLERQLENVTFIPNKLGGWIGERILEKTLSENDNYDLIFIYDDIDVILLHYFGSSIYHFQGNEKLFDKKVLAYVPVDTYRLHPTWITQLKKIPNLSLLAMNKYGYNLLNDADISCIDYLYHTIDFDLFQPPEDDTKRDGFLYIGRLDVRKNAEMLLELANFLTFNNQKVTLRIMLDQYSSYLLQSKLKQNDNLNVITTPIKTEDIVNLYRTHKYFITMTHFEGFGLPFLESARCKLPVIAFENPVTDEIMGGNYFRIPVMNHTYERSYNMRIFKEWHIEDVKHYIETINERETEYKIIQQGAYDYSNIFRPENVYDKFMSILNKVFE